MIKAVSHDFDKEENFVGTLQRSVEKKKPPTESFHTVSVWPLLWRLMQGWMRVRGMRGQMGGALLCSSNVMRVHNSQLLSHTVT